MSDIAWCCQCKKRMMDWDVDFACDGCHKPICEKCQGYCYHRGGPQGDAECYCKACRAIQLEEERKEAGRWTMAEIEEAGQQRLI